MSKYQPLITRLQQAVLGAAGTLPGSAPCGSPQPGGAPSAAEVCRPCASARVQGHQQRHHRATQRAGYNNDQIFEAVISTAVGASRSRLDSALNLLHKGKHEA